MVARHNLSAAKRHRLIMEAIWQNAEATKRPDPKTWRSAIRGGWGCVWAAEAVLGLSLGSLWAVSGLSLGSLGALSWANLRIHTIAVLLLLLLGFGNREYIGR